MGDYSKGLWQATTVCTIKSDHPETIVLKSTRKKNPKRFVVIKAVLCHYSTLFEKLFNGIWKESHEEKAEFDVELSQSVLRLVEGWLCTGCILTGFNPDLILKLYNYADYIGCLALKRSVLTHLHKKSGINLISYKALHDNGIWTERQDTPLYQWVVDKFAFHWNPSMDDVVESDDDFNGDDHDSPDVEEDKFNIPLDIPSSFLYAQRRVLYKYRQNVKRGIGKGECPCCSNVCKYHEHPSEDERRATCGAGEKDLLDNFKDEDVDDIDDGSEEAVGQLENRIVDAETERGNNGVKGNGIVNQDAGMDVNGKRKAHDDGQEEVSAKKHKQETES
ncbi:hypothetical protein KCU78_g3225, partial [Aureobasidium melanogenum]